MKRDVRAPELGQREDGRTEFKRAEKLRSVDGRRDLLRSVVALRNGSGGVLWIGATEREGAFAGWDPLRSEDERHWTALRDALLDKIEPRLRFDLDVNLDRREVEGGWVVALIVAGASAEPPSSCLREGNQREFLRREDSRIALIPHSQLFPAPRTRGVGRRERATPLLHDEASKCLAASGGVSITLDWSVEGANEREPPSEWRKLFEQPPEALENVRGQLQPNEFIKRARFLQSGHCKRGHVYKCTRGESAGRLFVRHGAEYLAWSDARFSTDEPDGLELEMRGRLDARALVDRAVSSCRLASEMIKNDREKRDLDQADVNAMLSLHGMKGWIWPVGHPMALRVPFARYWFQAREDVVVAGPFVRSIAVLRDAPDQVALHLLRALYEQCAHDSNREITNDQIVWFDPDGAFRVPR
jgi:hypothetical protein